MYCFLFSIYHILTFNWCVMFVIIVVRLWKWRGRWGQSWEGNDMYKTWHDYSCPTKLTMVVYVRRLLLIVPLWVPSVCLTKQAGYQPSKFVSTYPLASNWQHAHTHRGGHFLEAPVSGSKVCSSCLLLSNLIYITHGQKLWQVPADMGQLVFLCGGDEAVYNTPEVSQALDAMGKAKFLFGPVGQGSRVKLVVK